ncbi:MAG: NAD(P)/FAD-dependent oxidoreductase [Myxococcota bacterium]
MANTAVRNVDETPEAIVIGSGHNGLACACHLAKAGFRVLVLERDDTIGGLTSTREVTLPGLRHDIHAAGIQLANLSPSIAELELEERGFERIYPPLSYVQAFPDGRSISFGRDLDETCAELARFSEKDAEAWRALMADYDENKEAMVAGIFSPQPPGPLDPAQFAAFRPFLEQTFDSEEVRAAFAAWALHVGLGPDDEGSISGLGFSTIIQDTGNNPVKGGMQRLSDALASFLRDNGGEIETGAEVEKILVEGGRATGVRLADGTERRASKLVASNANPLLTALEFLGEDVVGPDIAAKMRNLEAGPAQMTIFLALDGPLEYAGGDFAHQSLYVHACQPSLDSLAQMRDEVRQGLLPREPLLQIVNEASVDPTRASDGRYTQRILVLPLPYDIKGDATGQIPHRNWDEAREPYADYAIGLAARVAPRIEQQILKRVVQDPVTMSLERADVLRGDICHVGCGPGQMGAARPIPEMGQYRTPVPNVYLCGSGSHPGPGVSMGPGRNAASVICDDFGVSFP